MGNEGGSNYRWYHIDQAPQFAVSLLTLIAVVIYACYARQQVEATQNANAIARAALTEANKPYVMFSSLFEPLTQDKNGIHKHVGMIWTNFGNTPALYPTWYMCTPRIRDNPNPRPYTCELLETPTKFTTIGPKQSINLQGPIVENSDLEATKDEKKAIYVFGFLKYEDKVTVDPYGNKKRRVTSFCQRIIQQNVTPTTNDTSTSAPTVQNVPFLGVGCQNYDYCIDDDCPALPEAK